MGPFKVRICFDWLRPGPQHCQGLGPIGELGHGRTSTSALPAPASVAILQWRGGGAQGELGAEPHVELSHSCRQFIELLVSFSNPLLSACLHSPPRTQPSREKSGKCWPCWVVKAPAPRANVDTGSWVMGGRLGGGICAEPRLLLELTAGCGSGQARRVPAASARSRTC